MSTRIRLLLRLLLIPLALTQARAEIATGPLSPDLLRSIFATSDVPDPSHCVVTPADAMNGMVAAPRLPQPVQASKLDIAVLNQSDLPMVGASVVVLLGASNPLCPTAVLAGTTDATGHVTITVDAMGCLDTSPLAGMIKANGVTIRAYVNVKSPDFDGASGNGRVNLADLLVFAAEFNGGPAGCHDYNNDNTTNLTDLVIFGQAFSHANHCP